MFAKWILLKMVLMILHSIIYIVTVRRNVPVISKDGEICIFPGPRLDANVWHLKLVGKL
jgi:hypothetical protein